MTLPGLDNKDRKQKIVNLSMAVIAGQVGCLTLVIVLVAVLGGLWLDSRLGTRPTFTLIFVLASIPISLLSMLFYTRATIKRIKTKPDQSQTNQQEGTDIGKHA
ncbi:MAG: AtpZ/AtpI family protein [Chloroflexi bacterium]|nr:AtpZ/AtpI family protein [Chloroflexota bacterium]